MDNATMNRIYREEWSKANRVDTFYSVEFRTKTRRQARALKADVIQRITTRVGVIEYACHREFRYQDDMKHFVAHLSMEGHARRKIYKIIVSAHNHNVVD